MRFLADLPPGFSSHSLDRATLVADARHLPSLVALGFDRPEAWIRATSGEASGPGRGATARVSLADGTRAVLKQMRRGGLLGPLWRDRFPPGRRLLRNLSVPLHALARAIPTARPLALLVLGGPPGLCRAWLATEEIAGARDLGRRIGGVDPPTKAEIDAVMAVVRAMHDRGIDHPDLNLGNLLVADPGIGPPPAFVIDLDRARLRPGPVHPAARIRALRRIERSAVKWFGERPVEAFDVRRHFYEAYAGGDARWTGLVERAQRANRRWIRLHRAGWGRRDAARG